MVTLMRMTFSEGIFRGCFLVRMTRVRWRLDFTFMIL